MARPPLPSVGSTGWAPPLLNAINDVSDRVDGIILRWDATARTWPARPSGAPWGVIWNSRNDPAATAPPTNSVLVGDEWHRSVDHS